MQLLCLDAIPLMSHPCMQPKSHLYPTQISHLSLPYMPPKSHVYITIPKSTTYFVSHQSHLYSTLVSHLSLRHMPLKPNIYLTEVNFISHQSLTCIPPKSHMQSMPLTFFQPFQMYHFKYSDQRLLQNLLNSKNILLAQIKIYWSVANIIDRLYSTQVSDYLIPPLYATKFSPVAHSGHPQKFLFYASSNIYLNPPKSLT